MTASVVAVVVHRNFAVEYHPEHVCKVVRGRLRWSSQKPQRKSRQRNTEKIAH